MVCYKQKKTQYIFQTLKYTEHRGVSSSTKTILPCANVINKQKAQLDNSQYLILVFYHWQWILFSYSRVHVNIQFGYKTIICWSLSSTYIPIKSSKKQRDSVESPEMLASRPFNLDKDTVWYKLWSNHSSIVPGSNICHYETRSNPDSF